MEINRKITIATAPSRRSTLWTNSDLTWQDLVKRLKQIIKTGETMAEYKAMTHAQRDARKDVGGFVGGCLKGGRRRKGCVEYRDVLTLDLDYAPSLGELRDILSKQEFSCFAYPTHSSTKEAPRYRVVIPFNRRVLSEEYEPIARKIAAAIGIDWMDATTYEPERLMYWPSVPSDADATVYVQDVNFLDADEVLEQYTNWRDATTWPVGKSETVAHERVLKKLGDPREKNGAVGLFCKAYNCREAIEVFLPNVYVPVLGNENRFTYAKGSTTGGAILYDDDLFLCSHHDTDPAGGGHEVNAFDLVRLHKFGAQDTDDDLAMAVNSRPSYKAMTKLAMADEKVRGLIMEDDLQRMRDDLIEEGVDLTEDVEKKIDEIRLHLEFNAQTKKYQANAANTLLVLRNDPRVVGAVGRDTFADRLTVLRKLPWETSTDVGRVWRDSDDANLRNWFTDKWGFSVKSAIDDGIAEMAEKNSFHPVRDYFEALPKWDGIPRAEIIFIEFLHAPDTPYTRAQTALWMKQGVARILHPGCKADSTLVLSGPQNIGKSFVLSRLGGKFFSDTLPTIQGKEGMVAIQGSWIVEAGEMQAMTRAGNEEIKAYLTRQVDKFRPPYGKRVQEYPRQCIFAATTNDDIFLKDRTGSRRFGILTCDGILDPAKRRAKLAELTDEYINQLWAEVLVMYKESPSLLLPDDIAAEAQRIQEEHTEGTEKAGLIKNFLDTPRPPDWDKKTIRERRLFLEGEPDVGNDNGIPVEDIDTSGYILPKRVCAMEILCELFEMDRKNIRNLDVREINTIMQHMEGWKKHESKGGTLRFPLYGQQRAFIRVSDESGQ